MLFVVGDGEEQGQGIFRFSRIFSIYFAHSAPWTNFLQTAVYPLTSRLARTRSLSFDVLDRLNKSLANYIRMAPTSSTPSTSIDAHLDIPEGTCVLTHRPLDVQAIIQSVGDDAAASQNQIPESSTTVD